ncbi:MAG: hypothetical protein HGA19_15390, partial [Oscillochloris sp.]|nr:hypothetical protein [Oscillochloris sp.]
MQTNYTEQDTERARQVEQSSAGKQTQQLRIPDSASYVPAGQVGTYPVQRNSPLAMILIGLGVVLLLARGVTLPLEITGGLVLLTISSCFFFFGLWKHIYGLIIPACILAGLSIGITFADLTDGVSVLWGLALGFLGIFTVGRALFGVRSQWPIFPAVTLFAVGVLVAVGNLPGLLLLGMI